MSHNLEIERKFLIKMPTNLPAGRVQAISQTYLYSERGLSCRVRKIVENGQTVYIFTEKEKLSDLTRIERERELTRAEYEDYLKQADVNLDSIHKTRHKIPLGPYVWEVDIFPFWHKQAILEVELPAEDAAFALPPWAEVIREVTRDKAYTNHAMARTIPAEE